MFAHSADPGKLVHDPGRENYDYVNLIAVKNTDDVITSRRPRPSPWCQAISGLTGRTRRSAHIRGTSSGNVKRTGKPPTPRASPEAEARGLGPMWSVGKRPCES